MKTLKTMSSDRLEELIGRFAQLRVAVIGDFFLDKYLDVEPLLAEVSLETGKTAHQVAGIRHSPGAAGTVVCNLSALGAGVLHAIGFTGDDGESYELRKDLAALRCATDHLYCDPERATPTYLKPRDKNDPSLAGEHNRYDTKNRVLTSGAVQGRLTESLDALLPQLDALIVADQVEEEDCGAITTRVAEAVAERARRFLSVVFWADSRRRIRRFRNVIIKPNQFEAVGITGAPPDAVVGLSELQDAVGRLRRRPGADLRHPRGARDVGERSRADARPGCTRRGADRPNRGGRQCHGRRGPGPGRRRHPSGGRAGGQPRGFDHRPTARHHRHREARGAAAAIGPVVQAAGDVIA